MAKKIFFLFLFAFLCPAFVLGYNFKFSSAADLVFGSGNDLDFNKATHESPWYSSQRFQAGLKAEASDNFYFVGKYQLSSYSGVQGPQDSSFASDDNNFKILDSYFNIGRDNGEYIRAGWQDVSLPSFTFGNPFLSGHTSAISAHGIFNDYVSFNMLYAHPFQTQDNMPVANSANIFALTADFKTDIFEAKPYISYSRVDQDPGSPYFWSSSPDRNLSYISAGGFAARLNLDSKTALSADTVFADHNNKGGHFFETKGYFYALLLERKEEYFSPGLFAWGSSGNKSGKLYKDNHWDYGFVPSVGDETSFAPTRLAFKGADCLGRDSLLSSTGIGTAGFGLQIKDIKSLPKLSHTLRGAYIRGTSSVAEAGNPADVTAVLTQAKPDGEPGIMSDKDHAVEIDFDSNYNINKWTDTILQAGFIRSSFKNQNYDKNIYNVQMIFRVGFD